MKPNKYLHRHLLHILMSRKDTKGNPLAFEVTFRKLSTGELVRCRARLSSWHSEGLTCNIIREGESRPIKIYRCLIVQFNSLPVIA